MKDRFQRASPDVLWAFTLIELLVVISVMAVLSSLLLPALAKAKARGQAIYCLNNMRQLNLAWILYAHDNSDRLVYNLGATEVSSKLALKQPINWVNNVLTWELDSDNTNVTLNTDAALGSYVARNPRVYRCPVDFVLSSLQKRAGWTARTRSLSMNAMVGDAGEFTKGGTNVNNPSYRQFFSMGELESTTDIFVFIEEHPDSINDGYFINKALRWGWNDLPASYHNGAANLSFADGHVELHRWVLASTKPPARPFVAGLPLSLADNERQDFYWLLRRTSTYTESDDSGDTARQ